MAFEYRVLPAPARGAKAKGAKGTAERFAVALGEVMNAMGAEGWEYLRAEALPCLERKGLTGSTEVTQHVLVFRRALREATAEAGPPESPEAIAAEAAASLEAETEPAFARSLGPARRAPDAPPRPARPLGPAREE
ncbi:hypothetical protein SAMN05444722_0902 [Rhodovulum sp. ES.010]|uniref:hypothetical protein n=1 Tax=Rhodovulum sp. ES.010 TaxID=1882821 RepID=UPI0009274DF8|nr:hypothetical protein [Rhodovulum sp. ES.010]SIO22548.1 hypothetical protein SAMN05444722_0902 [Rhodovulum sp. ES.010]